MKRLFLTSAGYLVIPDIAEKIGRTEGMNVMFVFTAAEPEEGDWPWIHADREALIETGFHVADYSITGKSSREIAGDIAGVDLIYIAGGNTFYLLEKIQQSGCAGVIRSAVEEGKIYIGSSAGCVVAGPDIYPTFRAEDAAKAPKLDGYEGLGLVDFVALPHWGNEFYKEFYIGQRMPLAYGLNHRYLLVGDHQYVAVVGDMYRILDAGVK